MKAMSDLQFSVRLGSSVDRYLVSEGAVAQAIDPRTMLVSSSFLGLSRRKRLKTFLHEVAHLQQLARPGNDPVPALEAEAWEAARAWISGRPFRVLGRSRKRLNALAIIQADEGVKHPSAKPWYSLNPMEPIGDGSTITVQNVIEPPSPMTFESVLDAIIQKKDSDVVIVCHGYDGQLALPLIKDSALGTFSDIIIKVAADQSFVEGGLKTPIIADKDIDPNLKEDQAKNLRAKMNQIRGMKLNHVAFRSCDLGKSRDSLDAFRRFFGSKSVSAPILYDAYGETTTVIGGNVPVWAEAKRKAGYRVWVENGFAFGLTMSKGDSLKFHVVSKASNDQAFTSWVRTHLSDRAGSNYSLVYHGIQDEFRSVPNPNSPVLHFVRDKAFTDKLMYHAG